MSSNKTVERKAIYAYLTPSQFYKRSETFISVWISQFTSFFTTILVINVNTVVYCDKYIFLQVFNALEHCITFVSVYNLIYNFYLTLLSSITVLSDSIHIGSISPSSTIHLGASPDILAISLIITENNPSLHSRVAWTTNPKSSSFDTALGFRSHQAGFFFSPLYVLKSVFNTLNIREISFLWGTMCIFFHSVIFSCCDKN